MELDFTKEFCICRLSHFFLISLPMKLVLVKEYFHSRLNIVSNLSFAAR